MATAATKPMTAEAFYEWVHRPENRDRDFELEQGQIVEMLRPGKRHDLGYASPGRIVGLNQVEQKCGDTAPLATIEVLSPNDTANNVMERVIEQLKFGVKLVWVIDPESETVAVYRPGKEPYLVKKGEGLTGDDVLPDFRVLVDEFFKLPGR